MSKQRAESGMWKKVEKNITQSGPASFRVRMSANGFKINKVFDSLSEARFYRDSHKLAQSVDSTASVLIDARLKKEIIKTVTVDKALDQYLIEVTPRKKGAKVEEYRIKRAKRTALAQKPLYGVTPADVMTFLREIGGTENNQRKYASLISHLYSTSIKRWGFPVDNPVKGRIDLPSNGKPRERRLRKGEYEALLDALSGEARSFVIIAIETAMRKSELFGLQWEDINLTKSSAILRDTKNGETRTTYFSSLAAAELKALKVKRKGPVFSLTPTQLRREWEAAREEIGAPDLHIHDLRHEGTSRLFEKGLNMIEVQSITGHKTLTELRKYTHLTPGHILSKLG